MRNTNKTFTLLLTLIIAMSCLTLLTVNPANAQTNTKPSVPEVTAKQLENQMIEITIKNQPFTPYTDSKGNRINFYYNFRYKVGSEWTYNPFTAEGISTVSYGGVDRTDIILYTASNSEHTIITYPLNKPINDFQVQAQIGYIQMVGSSVQARLYGAYCIFKGESSDWSPIQITSATKPSSQTVTLPPTLTPTVPTTPQFITSNPTVASPDISTGLANSITLPLNTFLTIIIVIVLLAMTLSVLSLKLVRRTHKKQMD